MAKWKRHFVAVPDEYKLEKYLNTQDVTSGSKSNFQAWLPEVYTGPANRIERYKQYEQMDKGSTDVSQSLDVIAEFCTQKEDNTNQYFTFKFNDEVTEAEIEVLNNRLESWTELNDFDKRLFDIVRNILMFGDEFFVRDPETYEWLWVDRYNVEKVIVNEAEGKKPEEYWIQNPDLNIQLKVMSPSQQPHSNYGYPSGLPTQNAGVGPSPVYTGGSNSSTSISNLPVKAEHIVHLSLNAGKDSNWPFGISILEKVYKAYKQVSLIEDAILIYRVHRAPERRVFYVDVGRMPPNRAMAHIERIKNEINQRRIPTRTGGGDNVLDATYNPMSMTEDYFFPQHADGRGSRVETLPGGENLGQINDLNYFNDQLKRGLNVPRAYIPSGSTEDTATYSDGRATTALIAEYRFTVFCQRIQSLINDIFDNEFKLYLKAKGITVDTGIFKLILNVPQNFAKYRQIELDNAMIATWASIADAKYISKRWAMERYLGLTENEIRENEKKWKEENPDTFDVEDIEGTDDLRSLGVRPPMTEPLDLGLAPEIGDEDISGSEESPITGTEPIEDEIGMPPPPPPPA